MPQACSAHLRVISTATDIVVADGISRQLYKTTNLGNGEFEKWRVYDKTLDDKMCRLFQGGSKTFALVQSRQDNVFRIADFSVPFCAWNTIVDLPEEQQVDWASAAVEGNCLYLVGGRRPHSSDVLDTVHCLDLTSQQWWPLPCMPSRRYACSVVVIGKKLYVAGGASKREDGVLPPCNSVEVFSLDDERWTRLKPTTAGRGQFVNYHGTLVTAGGILDDYGGEITNCVEMYDSVGCRWLPLPPMTTERSGHGLCVHADQIVALDGWDRVDQLKSVEAMELPC